MRQAVSACALLLGGCLEPNRFGGTSETDDATGTTGDGTMAPDGTMSTNPTEPSTSASGTTPTSTEPTGDPTGTGPAPVCGDGMVEGDEVCDDGVNDGSYGGCAEDCGSFGPYCGDGEIDAEDGETCDDANDVQGDGCNVDCLESGRELWVETHDGGGDDDYGRDVHIDDNGVALVLGELNDGTASTRLQWHGISDGELLDNHELTLVSTNAQHTVDGHYVVTRFSQLYFYNEDHIEVGNHDGDDEYYAPVDLSVDLSDGSVYVAASVIGQGWVQRVDSDGIQDWLKTGASDCERVVAVPDGGGVLARCGSTMTRYSAAGVEIFGYSDGSVDDYDIRTDGTYVELEEGTSVTARDDAGDELWTLDLADDDDLEGASLVAADEDGSTVVVGYRSGEIFVHKILPDGTPGWLTRHDDSLSQRPWAVDIAGDGTIVVTGEETQALGNRNIWVGAYAP